MIFRQTILYFLFLFVSFNSEAQNLVKTHDNWKWLSPFPHGGNFSCLTAVSSNVVVAGGYNGNALIYRSDDGGTTWTPALVPASATQTVTEIVMFEDGKEGFALSGNMLLHTLDGGKTWSIYKFKNQIYEPVTPTFPDPFIQMGGSLTRTDNNVFYAKIAFYDSLKFSFDNCRTFTTVKTPADVRNFYAVDNMNLMLIATENTATLYHFKSTDGGKNWIKKSALAVDGYFEYVFLNANDGYCAGYLPNATIEILRTADGGSTWTGITSKFQPGIKNTNIAFTKSGTGYLSASTKLYKTTDNGVNWTEIDSNQYGIDVQTFGDTVVYKSFPHVKLSFDGGTAFTPPYYLQPESYNYDITGFNALNYDFVSPFECNHKNLGVSTDGGRNFRLASGNPIGILKGNEFYQGSGGSYGILIPTYGKPFDGNFVVTGISEALGKYRYMNNRPVFQGMEKNVMYLCAKTKAGDSSIVLSIAAGTEHWSQLAVGSLGYARFNGAATNIYYPYLEIGSMIYTINNLSSGNSAPAAKKFSHSMGVARNGSFVSYSVDINGKVNESTGPAPGILNDYVSLPLDFTLADMYAVGDAIYKKEMFSSTWQNMGLPGSVLRAVDFDTVTTGFVAGDNCEIYSTINSGNFWSKSYKPTLKVSGLTGAYFLNDSLGYAISPSNLYQTPDGGYSWKNIASHSFGPNNKIFVHPDNSYAFVLDSNGALNRVKINDGTVNLSSSGIRDFYFISLNEGYAISSGEFFKTLDGGSNWTKVYTFNNVKLNAVSFANTLHGYVGGDLGKLYKTSDGGLNWTDVSVAGVKINGLSVVDSDTVFVGGDKGTFFFSYNGGTNWTPKASNTLDNLHHIKFFNSRDGYMVTSKGYIKTTDGGANFQLFVAPVKNNILPFPEYFEVGYERKSSSLFVINNSFKDFIYVNDINVLRNPEYIPYGQGGGTGAVTTAGVAGVETSIFPNPGRGLFTFAIAGVNSDVQFKVYSSIGLLVGGGALNSGNRYTSQLNFEALAAGLYHVVFECNGTFIRHSLIKN